MATLETLEEAGTYIIPFRSSRPRRSNSNTTTTHLGYDSNRTRSSFSEDNHDTPLSGGQGPMASSSPVRTLSDSASLSSAAESATGDGDSVSHHSAAATTDTSATDNNNNNNNNNCISYENRALPLSSAHWPQTSPALSGLEPYSASSQVGLAVTPEAVVATSISLPSSSSSSLSPSTSLATSSTVTSASRQEGQGSIGHNPATIRSSLSQAPAGEDEDLFDPDCAICLDRILPLRHAKAILACRHEFHLSCISMAFAMGKEMICPLCRHLHKDQPFMTLESDQDLKPSSTTNNTNTRHSASSLSSSRHHTSATLHEHPTSGTVLSMMPSLFETSLGHGPTAGTIRTAPNGICLRTSTWLLLYALPFTVALCFLAFVLGKVETLWSKISCLIGAAICYMACWALVVAIMDPDHEARSILERLDQDQRRQAILQAMRGGSTLNEAESSVPRNGSGSVTAIDSTTSRAALELTRRRTTGGGSNEDRESSLAFAMSSEDSELQQQSSQHQRQNGSNSAGADTLGSDPGWPYSVVGWVPRHYAQDIQNRLMDFSEMLDRVPDMMGEW